MSQRRSFGGPRREASERVTILGLEGELEAWTLNVSRGGLRLVVDRAVTVGADYSVQIGEGPARPARVVWVRDEADGQIAGMQFLDVEGGTVPGSEFPPSV